MQQQQQNRSKKDRIFINVAAAATSAKVQKGVQQTL